VLLYVILFAVPLFNTVVECTTLAVKQVFQVFESVVVVV
jgi:hypothetical protein